MKVILTLILTFSLATVTLSQPCSPALDRAWIRVSNAASDFDTLWCGFDFVATYGLNTQLCEIEYPPVPPSSVFDTRFVNIPGREGLDTPAGLGQGFHQDYRQFLLFERDTFKILIQAGVGGYPICLQWSSLWPLFQGRDSVLLVGETGGGQIRVRMDLDSTICITNPAVHSILIFAGRPVIQGVSPIRNEDPWAFRLLSNYPNPFNAGTTIVYQLSRRTHVRLAVYDLLGREVRVLVDGLEEQGTHFAGFDPAQTASGIYFCRLNADGFTANQKLVFQK